MKMQKILLFTTIGCRLNQTDTALMIGQLQPLGFVAKERVAEGEHVDMIIINTCTVTSTASQKSCQAFRKFRQKYPDAFIIVTGCSVNIEGEKWLAQAGVDLLLPADHRPKLLELLKGRKTILNEQKENIFLEGSTSFFPFKSRGYLKIQDGCNNFCSYCIVPYARGRERSRDFNEIMKDFKQLLEQGFEEIILVGVNSCSYKNEFGGLDVLLRQLLETEGKFRLRLSSVEPHESLMKIVDLMVEFPEKLCRFLHLPAQHLSDDVLKKMNRKYTFSTYQNWVKEARKRVANLHIGTDMIVGFPQETEHDFNLLCKRAEELQFANMHIFTYSIRSGTMASKMSGHIPHNIAIQRREILEKIAEKHAKDFARECCKKPCTILIEKAIENKVYSGLSEHFLRAHFRSEKPLQTGKLHTLILEESFLK